MKFNTLSILIFVLTISLVLNAEITRKRRQSKKGNELIKTVRRFINKISKNNYTYSVEDIQKISDIKERISKSSNKRIKKKLIRVLSMVKRLLVKNKQTNQGMMRLKRKEIQQLKKAMRMLNIRRKNTQRKSNLRRRNRKRYNKKRYNEDIEIERKEKYNDDRRGQEKEAIKEYVDKKVEKEVEKKLSKEIKSRRPYNFVDIK